MEAFSGILALAFYVGLVVLIVFGIKWYKRRKDKEAPEYKQYKKKFWIVFAVCAGLFVCSSIVSNIATAQEEARQEQEDKKNYKKDKEEFIENYRITAGVAESLSNDEMKDWENAIENSDDDFDVDSTIDNIEDKNSSLIKALENKIEDAHNLDQKIQDNSYASDSDKETVHKAYMDLKHFVRNATNISGSYNDFSDEQNELDKKVADRLEELKDME